MASMAVAAGELLRFAEALVMAGDARHTWARSAKDKAATTRACVCVSCAICSLILIQLETVAALRTCRRRNR